MADTKTPVKATKAAAPAAPKSSGSFDLSALAPVDAPAPTRVGGRGSNPNDNPALKWLDDSWNARAKDATKGAGKAVTVPDAAAKEVVNKLRYAANYRKLGVSIAVEENGNGTTTVRFAAKARKQKRTTNAAA